MRYVIVYKNECAYAKAYQTFASQRPVHRSASTDRRCAGKAGLGAAGTRRAGRPAAAAYLRDRIRASRAPFRHPARPRPRSLGLLLRCHTNERPSDALLNTKSTQRFGSFQEPDRFRRFGLKPPISQVLILSVLKIS